MVHACPLCSQIFKDSLLLESHFHAEHDVFINEVNFLNLLLSLINPVYEIS